MDAIQHITFNEVLSSLITTVLLPIVVRWLNQHTAAAAALEERHLREGKAVLTDHLESYLCQQAALFLQARLPLMAKRIASGQLQGAAAIRAELYGWGDDLKKQAIDLFNHQGVDLIKEIGPVGLDQMVAHAAAAVSPFHGMETSKVLSDKDVALAIVQKGIAAVANDPNLVHNPDEVEIPVIKID